MANNSKQTMREKVRNKFIYLNEQFGQEIKLIFTYGVIVWLSMIFLFAMFKGRVYAGWETPIIIIGAGCLYYLWDEILSYANNFRRDK